MNHREDRTARVTAALIFAGGMAAASPAPATLLDRGPNMVYDDVLDITWTRQAGDGALRSWADATDWAANLVVDGIAGWRLPYASKSAPNGGAGPIQALPIVSPCTGAGGADEIACRDNEMGYMFYYNLGGAPNDDLTGDRIAVGGEMITGIQTWYWSATQYSLDASWFFAFLSGYQQDAAAVFPDDYAWAVRSGDVRVVPVPGSALLVGLGLLGLGWRRHRPRPSELS